MTAQEAIAYIEDCGWSVTRLGLQRTKDLLYRMGNPQKYLKFIHVTGSNGKGSTCAMLAAILREAGYRVGLYTSPYIQEFSERIRVNGENIPDQALSSITEQVKKIADSMCDHPSQFELVTAVAMQYFRNMRCDIVVLEVGMGGTKDSTNVIDSPEVAVITNIGLEHTEYLGHDLAAIARTKAGIIKTGCHCVCYDNEDSVINAITTRCLSKGVPLLRVRFNEISPMEQSIEGQRFLWKDKPYFLSLLGSHQLHNAAVVLNTVEVLRSRGWCISQDAVHAGLQNVCWPARLEILHKAPLFILDGGHNPQCARALAESFRSLLPNKKAVFLCGVLADKDYAQIFDQISPLASAFVCVSPESPRALPADALASWMEERGLAATSCNTIEEGLVTALRAAGESGIVVVFGSLYLAGKVRSLFPTVYRSWLRKEKIRRRNELNKAARAELSAQIVSRLEKLPAFQNAKTVLLYRAVRGEVNIDSICVEGKRAAYPLVLSKHEMIALCPNGPDAWTEGYQGIAEPIPEKSQVVYPEEIDLVICPCSSFDERCNRMGMGGGFYDRYLERCTNAVRIAVAFEDQKSRELLTQDWDQAMDAVATEKKLYTNEDDPKK